MQLLTLEKLFPTNTISNANRSTYLKCSHCTGVHNDRAIQMSLHDRLCYIPKPWVFDYSWEESKQIVALNKFHQFLEFVNKMSLKLRQLEFAFTKNLHLTLRISNESHSSIHVKLIRTHIRKKGISIRNSPKMLQLATLLKGQICSKRLPGWEGYSAKEGVEYI